MKKRILIIALTLVLVISLFPVSAFASSAYNIRVSGSLQMSSARDLLNLINNERMDEDLEPLVWDNYYEKQMAYRAVELSLIFSNTRPNGGDGTEWYLAYGYTLDDLVDEIYLSDEPFITDPDLTTFCAAVFIDDSGCPFYALIGGYEQLGDSDMLGDDGNYYFDITVKDGYMNYYGEFCTADNYLQDPTDLKKGKTYKFYIYNSNKKIDNREVYEYLDNDFSVKSSNTKVATINSKGTIKTKRAGYAQLIIKPNKSSDLYFEYNIVVRPQKVTGVKVTSPKRKTLKIRWKKIAGANGYQIYRATSKNGTYKLVKTINKGSTTSWTNKSLKSGKKYYYKVRAFVKYNGDKYPGAYSSKVSKRA